MSSGAGEGYIGKSFNFRHSGRVVTVQSVLGEGGFSLVFLVTTPSNQRYALKRMCVNNEHDLESCRREIAIVKSTYNGHKNAVKYVDSMETVQKQGIYEILLLMQYCSGEADSNSITSRAFVLSSLMGVLTEVYNVEVID